MKKISDKLQVLGLLIVGIIISSVIATKAATTLSSTSVYYDTSKSGGSSSNVNGAIDELYSLTTDRDKLKTEIVNIIYPVGSVYTSTEDDTVEKVQERFGGTWERYAEGTMLMSVDSNHAVNTTGGSSTVTLSVSNLPSHNHVIPSLSGTTLNSGAHTHPLKLSVGSQDFVVPNLVGTGLSPISSTGTSIQGHWFAQSYIASTAGSHTHAVTTTASNTTTCTNCSATSFSVQNPYTAVYMYKRTA